MDHQGVQAVFETARHRIVGWVRLPREGYRSRLTDYLNAPEHRFVPLTEAMVTPLNGGPEVHQPFLLLAVESILMAQPIDADRAD